MRILVTGASGHIGSALSKDLVADGHQLVFVLRSGAKPPVLGNQYAIDLSDPAELPAVLAKERPDAIIHLAAILGAKCEADPKLAQAVNVESTKLLAELALRCRVKKFIFASTAAVYNQTTLHATDEEHNVDPQSAYGKSKLRAEQTLADSFRQSATQCAVLRIFNVYGPMFENSLVYKLAHSSTDMPVRILTPDLFYRDYIYIDDVVAAICDILTNNDMKPYEIYNIASGRAHTTSELIAQLKQQGITPHYVTTDHGLDVSWANIDKVKNTINFKPSQSINFLDAT